ncbi:hypothetical protein A7982_12909 [Minicystis rosea]|nr:hypothetical protein A7982_12909 [Minicystis rosea]
MNVIPTNIMNGIHRLARSTALLALFAAAGCGGDLGSEEDAARVYQGLDASIDKAIQLGFDGFNAASSANIPEQTAMGTKKGTMTIGGKVDQGSSSNKTMSLTEVLVGYSDDGLLVYDTPSGAPAALDMKLSKVPDGTLEGSLSGQYAVSGDLAGTVTLTVSFTSDLEPVPTDDTKVQRKPETTHITGTATSDYGTYTIDITR